MTQFRNAPREDVDIPAWSTSVTLQTLRVDVLRAPLHEALSTSFATLTHRSMVMVTLTSSDGRSGTGESWVNFPPWSVTERMATLAEGVVPVLRADPTGTPREVYLRLASALEPIGRQWGAPGPVAQSISGVDIAMWDLAGRVASDAPGSRTGRVRDVIPVYASGLGPTRHREDVERALACGHRAVKVKVGFGHDEDIRAVRLVRDVAGPDIAVYVDANQAWTVDEAAAIIPAFRETGVSWIEEPLRGDRLEDLEELHRRTGFPIVTGENLYGVDTFVRYMGSPAITAIQPDLSKMGGPTPAYDVARHAVGLGCAVYPHLFNGALAYAASLHFAAVAAPVALLELDVRENALRDPMICDPPVVTDGLIRIPSGPGHGISLDHRAAERYVVESREFDLT